MELLLNGWSFIHRENSLNYLVQDNNGSAY